MIYENCKIYGPYDGEKGRKIIQIIFPDSKSKTPAFARYLMEIKINRYLEDYEQVDHIDKNFLNDDEENLQILKIGEHQSLDILRISDVSVNCVYCGKEFSIKGNKIKDRNRKSSGPFCSRECGGRYGAEKQNGRIEKLENIKVERSYYSNKNKLK